MQLYVMSVRDAKAGCYGTPFYVSYLGQAERDFSDEVNRAAQDNALYMHPEDFELFKLGVFDTETAVFVLDDRPVPIVSGVQIRKTSN